MKYKLWLKKTIYILFTTLIIISISFVTLILLNQGRMTVCNINGADSIHSKMNCIFNTTPDRLLFDLTQTIPFVFPLYNNYIYIPMITYGYEFSEFDMQIWNYIANIINSSLLLIGLVQIIRLINLSYKNRFYTDKGYKLFSSIVLILVAVFAVGQFYEVLLINVSSFIRLRYIDPSIWAFGFIYDHIPFTSLFILLIGNIIKLYYKEALHITNKTEDFI